jgi:hypothetical protein
MNKRRTAVLKYALTKKLQNIFWIYLIHNSVIKSMRDYKQHTRLEMRGAPDWGLGDNNVPYSEHDGKNKFRIVFFKHPSKVFWCSSKFAYNEQTAPEKETNCA